MKSAQQLQAEWQAHQDEILRREQRWAERHRLFIRRAMITSAIVYALTIRAQAFGGEFTWWLWFPSLVIGALAAWPIAKWRLGPLAAAPVYGAITMTWEVTICAIGGIGIVANFGGILVLVNVWAFWVIYGVILGYIAQQYDDDTIQI